MFTKRVIPCLDVHEGRVVKGVNFVDLKDARRSGQRLAQRTDRQARMSLYFWILRLPPMPEQPSLIWYAGWQRPFLFRLPWAEVSVPLKIFRSGSQRGCG